MSALARAASDRNLLFGILALQMDFISRDALIRGMHAWVLEKTKPLGQLLVEQGAMAEDARTLLEPLVQKHLQIHSDDPAKSLASIGSAGCVRQVLEQIADPDVQATLAHASAIGATAADLWPTMAPSVGMPTSAGLRFRVLRPHAKGGLGQVSIALDEELHREVVLKEIQDRYADDPNSRARFLLEAEITGGLEHPGIVPVYGLGSYPDGRPFYAMRFIKGDSLQEAIARFHKEGSGKRDPRERTLALRQLLGRFIDVCDAIAYAHSRGVLHRDLKPGNVMLGPYGETLVVDWGLAKPMNSVGTDGHDTIVERPLQPALSDSATPTQAGMAIGTPAYMPPEQAAGQLDELGPTSDVYSLGATLYCLLTGKPPFESGEVGEILRKVQAADFPRPREVCTEVPAALEAVCLKAMARLPQDRYPCPRALAADVERWLADEPVSAWRESVNLKARRWVKRHQSWVAASAVAIIVAFFCLSVAATLLAQTNGLLRQAKAEEETAKELAVLHEREASEQRDLARANLLEAEEQRDRSHFYLETILNLKRFGRSLQSRPLRRDFDIRIRLVNGSRGELKRGAIARGDFDREQGFHLSIESSADCFLYVFYAIPPTAIDTKDWRGDFTAPTLLVFPNAVEHNNRITASTKRLLLNSPELFLSPVRTTSDFAYLYVLATEKDSEFKPDEDYRNFYTFSSAGSIELCQQIAEIIGGMRDAARKDRGKITEEIFMFNVRSEAGVPEKGRTHFPNSPQRQRRVRRPVASAPG